MESCCPADRPGCPEEIAAAIALLGPVEPRYVTGSNPVTDGGMTAWWLSWEGDNGKDIWPGIYPL